MTKNPYETHKPTTGGGLFFKPETGKEYAIRIVGEPVVFSNNYTNQETGDVKVSTRYAWIVYNHTTQEAQIFQLPPSGYQDIYDLAIGEWGDPETYDLTYKKTGEKLETRHSIQPKKKSIELTDEQIEECKNIDLKEAIGKSPSSNSVYYISETEDKPTNRKRTEEIDDEPISLDDIPI